MMEERTLDDSRREYYRRWTQENREHLKAYRRDYRAKNRARIRSNHIKHRFGITSEDYERMLVEQGGVCAICKGPSGRANGTYSIDHDHKCCPSNRRSCGKCVRGLLCVGCNTRLAVLENEEWTEKARGYLDARSR
jgi:hypothetical protein